MARRKLHTRICDVLEIEYPVLQAGMGAALYSGVEEDEICTTMETEVVFFKPVKSGTLTCESRVLHRSRSLAATEAEVKRGTELAAKALGTWSIHKENAGKDRKE